uniref:Uncharacterized protein n=1 Tax=Tetradesmus obliquus TaxID=3088 RepID=A0A383W9K0_TETOB|eukprot:jgi/Sobl393_1/4898/SZX73860.1
MLAYRLNNTLLEQLKELQLQQGGECAHGIGESCSAATDGTARPCHSGTCSGGTASGSSNARASCSHSEAAAAGAAAMEEGTAAAAGAAAAAAGSSAAGDAERDESYSEARRQSLLRQEQRSAKMKRLMGKEAFLRVCFASYLYGQLTWVQLARLFALMFPRYPMPNMFFSAVAAKVAREQQQQQ